MITLERTGLEFCFPQVDTRARCGISFQRTLRIPDDNREYPLPPGLGTFPLLHTEDYADTTPASWQERGGVFLPMYQAEAMWMNFSGDWPCAVKIAAGKINAVTGEPWSNDLTTTPQDYVVIPEQPWLDGFCIGEGLIRQFVAMPLGEGFTAEEQLTGKASVGGIQICVYPMKKEVYQKLVLSGDIWDCATYLADSHMDSIVMEDSMGLAPGGLMRQQIFEDDYGIEAWDTTAMARCFVHLANSEQYLRITGQKPPTKPPTAKEYNDAGMPWFEYYAHDTKALGGAKKLAELDSVAARSVKMGRKVLEGNDPVSPARVVALRKKGSVSDGRW